MWISWWVRRTKHDLVHQGAWGPRSFTQSSLKQSVEDPKGKVTLKEVSRSEGQLTQASPAFQSGWPRLAEAVYPATGPLLFLSDLHLNKQIRNVICSQAENRARIPQGTGDSPAAGRGEGELARDRRRPAFQVSFPVQQVTQAGPFSQRHWFLEANYQFMQ